VVIIPLPILIVPLGPSPTWVIFPLMALSIHGMHEADDDVLPEGIPLLGLIVGHLFFYFSLVELII